MIFGVSFAIGADQENIKWTKTSKSMTISRVSIGLITTLILDFLIGYILEPH